MPPPLLEIDDVIDPAETREPIAATAVGGDRPRAAAEAIRRHL
jgi:hypothetical protein